MSKGLMLLVFGVVGMMLNGMGTIMENEPSPSFLVGFLFGVVSIIVGCVYIGKAWENKNDN